ncbi:MAG: hypothetical protein ABL962_04420 [Fimbriimonadaceae bacterium]
MRTRYIIVILVVHLITMSISGQIKPIASEFGMMTLPDAEKAINTAEGGRPPRDFAAAALRSGRVDLASLCIEHYKTRFYVYEGIATMPDGAFRDQVLILILKCKSGLWPSEQLFSVNPRSVEDETILPLTPAIKKHLPNVPISVGLISTRAARLKLAADIEAAIARENQEKTGLPAQKTSQARLPLESDSASPLQASPKTEAPKPVLKAVAASEQSASTSWLAWAAVIIATIGLLWLALKKRN